MLLFQPGETLKTISIPIIDDARIEPDETFLVRLIPRTLKAEGCEVVMGKHAMTRVLITDDDADNLDASVKSAVTESPVSVHAFPDESVAEAEGSRDDRFSKLRRDKDRVESMIPMLPLPLQDYLTGPGFMQECQRQFASLDVNGDGVLDAIELQPVIEQLAKQMFGEVNDIQTEKWIQLFDDDHNDSIDANEFFKMSRFLIVASTVDLIEKNTGSASEGKQPKKDESNTGKDTRATTTKEPYPKVASKGGEHKPQQAEVCFTSSELTVMESEGQATCIVKRSSGTGRRGTSLSSIGLQPMLLLTTVSLVHE